MGSSCLCVCNFARSRYHVRMLVSDRAWFQLHSCGREYHSCELQLACYRPWASQCGCVRGGMKKTVTNIKKLPCTVARFSAMHGTRREHGSERRPPLERNELADWLHDSQRQRDEPPWRDGPSHRRDETPAAWRRDDHPQWRDEPPRRYTESPSLRDELPGRYAEPPRRYTEPQSRRNEPPRRHDKPLRWHGEPPSRRDEPASRHEPLSRRDEYPPRHDEPCRRRDEPARRHGEPWHLRNEPPRRHDRPSRRQDEASHPGQCDATLHASDRPTQKRKLPDSAASGPPARSVPYSQELGRAPQGPTGGVDARALTGADLTGGQHLRAT